MVEAGFRKRLYFLPISGCRRRRQRFEGADRVRLVQR
jgi:hypothetical protein